MVGGLAAAVAIPDHAVARDLCAAVHMPQRAVDAARPALWRRSSCSYRRGGIGLLSDDRI